MNRQLSTSHPRWAPYVFIAPFVLVFCTFMVYPLGQSIVLAMQQTFGPKTTVFVGLKNFAPKSPEFCRGMWHPLQLACAFSG